MFIVAIGDKGLGGVIMERPVYVQGVLQEHLLQKATYRQLGPGELEFIYQVMIKRWLKRLSNANKREDLTKYDLSYFAWAWKQRTWIPQFYCNPKVHKDPWKLHPVTGIGGSLLAAAFKWVDVKLKEIFKFVPTYIFDWEELIRKLVKLSKLPIGALLFTADATSMYTNIDTIHCLLIIKKWID